MKFRSCIAMILLAGATTAAHGQQFVPTTKEGESPRVQYRDSLVSLNDMCAVANRKLSLSVDPIYVNQKPVSFCCTACPGIFSRNPVPYVSKFAPKLACVVHPTRTAIFDSTAVVYVNHDVFYFSDAKARQKFVAQPLKFAKHLTDPVSRNRFAPSSKSPHTVHGGRHYFFENGETLTQFKTAPGNYAIRSGA